MTSRVDRDRHLLSSFSACFRLIDRAMGYAMPRSESKHHNETMTNLGRDAVALRDLTDFPFQPISEAR